MKLLAYDIHMTLDLEPMDKYQGWEWEYHPEAKLQVRPTEAIVSVVPNDDHVSVTIRGHVVKPNGERDRRYTGTTHVTGNRDLEKRVAEQAFSQLRNSMP